MSGTSHTTGGRRAMDGLMEFKTEDGAMVVVEGVDDESGARLVSRGEGPARAARTFEGALDGVRAAGLPGRLAQTRLRGARIRGEAERGGGRGLRQGVVRGPLGGQTDLVAL